MTTKRTTTMLAAGICASALVFAAGCGKKSETASTTTTAAAETTTTAAESAAPAVTDVWARTSPMMTSMGAAYATIKGGAEDDKLVGAMADASVAKTVELHEVVMADTTTTAADGMASTTAADGMATTTAAMSGEMTTTTAADGMATTTAAVSGDMTTTTAADGMATTTAADGMTTTTMAGSEAMTMRPVEAIDIPAGETVMLKPGGYHIMLIDLAKPLKVGDKIDLTLKFEKAGEVKVVAEVKEG